jgi:hypothetical protein
VRRTGQGCSGKSDHETKAGSRNVPAMADKSIFPTDNFVLVLYLSAWCQTPSSGTKCLVEDSPVLDFGQVDQAICDADSVSIHTLTSMEASGGHTRFDFHIVRIYFSHQNLRNLLWEGRR